MLKTIEEFGAKVEISGFRTEKIEDPQDFLRRINEIKSAGIQTQLFDSSVIATWQHLYFAALNALTAFNNKTNISRSIAMETLLYAAAERQIAKATTKLGVSPRTTEVAVLIIGKDEQKVKSTFSRISKLIDGKHDETVLSLTKPKISKIEKVFNISDAEFSSVKNKDNLNKALVDLILERIALVSSER